MTVKKNFNTLPKGTAWLSYMH